MPFDISVWFLLSLALLMFTSGGLAVWALLAAAVQEAEHLLFIYACGCKVGGVSFNAGGARITLAGEPTRRGLFLIILSGSLGNLLAAAAVKISGGASLRTCTFMGANLVLCVLNILTHSSLDGGKLLRLLLPETEKARKSSSRSI